MRQAYDYWQDQPGSIPWRRRSRTNPLGPFGRDRLSHRGTGPKVGGLPPARFAFCVREHEQSPVHRNKRSRVLPEHGCLYGVHPVHLWTHGAERDRVTSDFRLSGYVAQEPHNVPAPLAAGGLINERDRGETVRCASKEPADPNDPSTTHAPSRTTGDNPAPTNQETHRPSADK